MKIDLIQVIGFITAMVAWGVSVYKIFYKVNSHIDNTVIHLSTKEKQDILTHLNNANIHFAQRDQLDMQVRFNTLEIKMDELVESVNRLNKKFDEFRKNGK